MIFGTPVSPAELECLHDLAAGLGVKATAARLRLSPETVRSQRKSLYLRLGARNGPHAVALAYQKHLLTTTEQGDP